ncbi:MAG: hypothetical protein GY874_15765 [Desulfobacteraceae bacterium]|nr:hypothetical protein [Desulfobacteraceae bacterium]
MKKLLVAIIAVTFVVGLAANTALAEDRLSLSGTMRVRAWAQENYTDLNSDDNSDKENYWDQRFRVQTIISPAEGVKGVLRFDFSEQVWGSDDSTGVRPHAGTNSQLQVDRAYLDVTKGIVNVKAGQQYMGLGSSYAYDNNATGIDLSIATPVIVRLGYAKENENASNTDLDETGSNTKDTDQYYIDLTYKTDAFTIEGFYAAQIEGRSYDDTDVDWTGEPRLIGIMGKFGVGPVNVVTELNSFSGDASDTTEYTGLQFVADVSMDLSDQLTLGTFLSYSDGSDDADEIKITRMPNAHFGSTFYGDYGAFATDIAPLGVGDIFNPTGDESASGNQTGAMGIGLYAKFALMEELTLYGQLGYLAASEDIDDQFENGTIFGVSAEYLLTQACKVALGYHYLAADFKNDTLDRDDAAQTIAARMQIDF